MEEQEGDKLPPVVERRLVRHQPHCETRTECLEQCFNILTKLVRTLVAALGQNASNVAPAIPLGIPLANAEGGEALLPQEGGDATTSEARTEASQH